MKKTKMSEVNLINIKNPILKKLGESYNKAKDIIDEDPYSQAKDYELKIIHFTKARLLKEIENLNKKLERSEDLSMSDKIKLPLMITALNKEINRRKF
jgi:hypothetical protein